MAFLRDFMTSNIQQKEGAAEGRSALAGRGKASFSGPLSPPVSPGSLWTGAGCLEQNRLGWSGGLCGVRIRKKDLVLHNPACLLQTIRQGRIVRRCRTASVRKTPPDREARSGMRGAWETQRGVGAGPEGAGMRPGCHAPKRLALAQESAGHISSQLRGP